MSLMKKQKTPSYLYICNYFENLLNKRPMNNTGLFHICFDVKNNMYRVYFNNDNINNYFNDLNDAIIFRDNYIKEHPNDFYYNSSEDYINRNNPNAIKPFIFINPEERK